MKEKQKEKDKSVQLRSLNGWIVHSPHQNWTLERAQNKRWILNNKILEKRNRLRKSRYSLNGENGSCILSVLILRNPKLENNDAHKIPKWQRFWNILFPCLPPPLFFSLSTTIKPLRANKNTQLCWIQCLLGEHRTKAREMQMFSLEWQFCTLPLRKQLAISEKRGAPRIWCIEVRNGLKYTVQVPSMEQFYATVSFGANWQECPKLRSPRLVL